MAVKRPFKVSIYYPARPNQKEIKVNDSFGTASSARELARTVSRCGGTSRVWVKDPDSKDTYTLSTYEPYEITD